MPGTIQTEPTADNAPRCRGIYHLTHPRSASNLFQSMLAKQPGFYITGYKFLDSAFATMRELDKGPWSTRPEEERQALHQGFQQAFNDMEKEIEDAEKNGMRVLIKEHTVYTSAPDKLTQRVYDEDNAEPMVIRSRSAGLKATYTNPTSLPDEFLLSLQPIFQIRHPILMFPSLVRAQRDTHLTDSYGAVGKLTLSLRPSKQLYDWYMSHSEKTGIIPRIIDADDVMNDPAAVRQLCLETGMHPDAVVYEWETRRIEDPRKARFLSTIAASKGIIPGLDSKGKSVEGERNKWIGEFGEEGAEALARFVYDAMPDYEYLHCRRTVGGE